MVGAEPHFSRLLDCHVTLSLISTRGRYSRCVNPCLEQQNLGSHSERPSPVVGREATCSLSLLRFGIVQAVDMKSEESAPKIF